MDKLTDCAHAFERLLNIQYRITVGRKGTERLHKGTSCLYLAIQRKNIF